MNIKTNLKALLIIFLVSICSIDELEAYSLSCTINHFNQLSFLDPTPEDYLVQNGMTWTRDVEKKDLVDGYYKKQMYKSDRDKEYIETKINKANENDDEVKVSMTIFKNGKLSEYGVTMANMRNSKYLILVLYNTALLSQVYGEENMFKMIGDFQNVAESLDKLMVKLREQKIHKETRMASYIKCTRVDKDLSDKP